MLAAGIQRWGLDKRIALKTMQIVGTSPGAIIAGVMIATGFISNVGIEYGNRSHDGCRSPRRHVSGSVRILTLRPLLRAKETSVSVSC